MSVAAVDWKRLMARRDLSDEEEARIWLEAVSDPGFRVMIVNQFRELEARIRYVEERLENIKRTGHEQ